MSLDAQKRRYVYLQSPHTHQHQQIEQFLEQELPIRAIAHLTFPVGVQREEADDHFHRWIKTIQEGEQTQLGYIVAYERAKGTPMHLHSALIAPKPLDTALLQKLWQMRMGEQHQDTIRASEYQPGLGGVKYILKADDEDLCDVRFSNNLALFGSAPTGASSRDRRRIRRIHQERAA